MPWTDNHSRKMMVIRFLLSVTVFVAISFILRFFANSSRFLFSHYGDVFKTALCISLALQIWDFDRKAIKSFMLFSLLYIFAACIKLFVNMPLSGKEIADAYCFANIICAVVLLLWRILLLIKNIFIKRLFCFLFNTLLVAALIPPVAYIGYYCLSGQLLSATIVLTLFQTNFSEAAAYIKDRGVLLWGGGILITLLSVGGIVYFINRIRFNSDKENKNVVLCILSIVILVLGYKVGSGIVDNVQSVAVYKQTGSVLKQYEEYGKAKEKRMKALKQLTGLTVRPGQGGLYVLVIGESETRDHMQAYGYKKENTPWLSAAIQDRKAILFRNAYSNHTHTVPVLTYALSEKNQYNDMPLSKAYSVMEVAKAAGYKTLWISNQIKYGAWDTPTAEMASTANREIWLNGSAGKNVLTQYYDEEVAKRIEAIDFENGENVFIVCHLMGCHNSYSDRYPERFDKFNGEKTQDIVSQYDNSVYYNDYVLKKIFEAVSRQKNFKAMVYFSDHGEEPDKDKGHDAGKFTWQMARIPLVMFFSESFVRDSDRIFQSLSENKEKYWTNDLLYNALVVIMGIQNAPNDADNLNLASDKYNMERKQLKTLHRKKSLLEDIR